jgi:hypothetical protein
VRTCVSSTGDPHDEPCGSGTCLEDYRASGHRYAACSFKGRDTRCDAAAQESSFCRGETIVACRGAYPQGELDCTSRGLVCETSTREDDGFVTTHLAQCVKTHDKDPRCIEKGSRTDHFCDGERAVGCFGEHRIESNCLDLGRHCRMAPEYPFALCLYGEAPDPRCVPNGENSFCDGDTAVRCDAGYRSAQEDCARISKRCVFDQAGVRCD